MSLTTLLLTAVAAIVVLVVATLIVRRVSGASVVEPTPFNQPSSSMQSNQSPQAASLATIQKAHTDSEFQQALAKGNKIAAIKRVRELTGMGLKESKDYTDALMAGSSPPLPAVVARATPPMEDVATLAASGRKIEAIKRYREITGVGLKEAKDYVDSLMP